MAEEKEKTKSPNKKESVGEMYKRLEQESLDRIVTGRSGKSQEIRELVIQMFDELKKPKLLQAAVFKAIESQMTGLDRTQFTGVIKRSFKTEKDEETGRIWIFKP